MGGEGVGGCNYFCQHIVAPRVRDLSAAIRYLCAALSARPSIYLSLWVRSPREEDQLACGPLERPRKRVNGASRPKRVVMCPAGSRHDTLDNDQLTGPSLRPPYSSPLLSPRAFIICGWSSLFYALRFFLSPILFSFSFFAFIFILPIRTSLETRTKRRKQYTKSI